MVRAIYPDFQEERKAGPAISPNESGWFGLAKANQSRVPRAGRRTPTRCRCAASTSTRRCASRRRAARCRASASSASARRARASPSIPIHSPALVEFDDKPEQWLDVRWDLDKAQEVAVPDPDRGHHAQRARRARRGRDDDRRDRRQYRQRRLQPDAGRISARFASISKSRDIQHLNAVIAQLRDKRWSARSSGSAGEAMPLYFAYGANMDVAAMAQRCPRSKPLGLARLMRHRLAVMREGWLTVARDPRAAVHGVLWDLALADVAALDRFEGVARRALCQGVQPVLAAERRRSGRWSISAPTPARDVRAPTTCATCSPPREAGSCRRTRWTHWNAWRRHVGPPSPPPLRGRAREGAPPESSAAAPPP